MKSYALIMFAVLSFISSEAHAWHRICEKTREIVAVPGLAVSGQTIRAKCMHLRSGRSSIENFTQDEWKKEMAKEQDHLDGADIKMKLLAELPRKGIIFIDHAFLKNSKTEDEDGNPIPVITNPDHEGGDVCELIDIVRLDGEVVASIMCEYVLESHGAYQKYISTNKWKQAGEKYDAEMGRSPASD